MHSDRPPSPPDSPKPRSAPGLAPGTVLAGRFEIERRLGEGGMGVVYAARDRQTDGRVAIKTLSGRDPREIAALKQEFRALADVGQENLVGLYELFGEDGLWFFTMELVLGRTFVEHVREFAGAADDDTLVARAPGGLPRPSPPSRPVATEAEVSLEALRAALVQLVRGVAAIHAAGKLHRDLKPSNVLVTSSGRVVILDFGLVGDVARDGARTWSPDIAGTPAYMAPEQVTGEASPASDWYAVGIMLYEALTGSLPFSGESLQIFADKQIHDVPDVRAVAEVPGDLADLVRSLTRRVPEARPSVEGILRALHVDGSSRPPAPQPVAARGRLLVGREPQLALLGHIHAEARAGRHAVALVEGASGVGKTALIDAFVGGLGGRALVLMGRCFEREALPFKALDGVVDRLATLLERMELEHGLSPERVDALVRLFPVLERVPSLAAGADGVGPVREPFELRRVGAAALRDVLRSLAESRDVVVVMDDLQWGDVDGAQLLAELLVPDGAPGVTFVLSYRTEEISRTAGLRALLEGERSRWRLTARVVAVEPLAPADAEALARLALPDGDGMRVRSICEAARGNPGLLLEFARHAEALDLSAKGPGSEALAAVVAARVAELGDAARRLLDVVALAGRPIALMDALRAAGLSASERGVSVSLIASRFLRATRLGEHSAFVVHDDTVRAVVTSGLSDADRSALHGRIADALAASTTANPEMLVDHLAGAGRTTEALEQALAAARRAGGALAYDTEAALYRKALQWAAPDEADALGLECARALGRAGRLAEAGRLYLSAAETSPERERAELRRCAADHLVLAGHLEEAIVILDDALHHYGLSMPEVPADGGVDPSFMEQMGRLMQRGLGFSPRSASEIGEPTLREIDLLWSVGWGLHLSSYRGKPFVIRHLIAALDAGEIERVVRGLGLYVQLLSAIKLPVAGQVLGELARVASGFDDPRARFWVEYASAGNHRYEGRAVTACVHGPRAEAALQALPSVASRELGCLHASRANHILSAGRYAEFMQSIPEWLADARARGDLFGTVWMLGHQSNVELLRDDPGAARSVLAEGTALWHRPEADDMQQALNALQQLRVDLYALDHARLRQKLEQTAVPPNLEASPFFRAFALSLIVPARLATHGLASDPDADLALVARAADAVEALDMETEAPLAPIFRAGMHAVSGDRAAALAELDRAAELALEPEAVAFRDLVAIARVDVDGSAESRQAADGAITRLRAEGVRDPERWARTIVVLG